MVTTLEDSSFAWRKTRKRRPILCAGAHQRRQAFNRFHVVIVNVRAGIEHDLDAPILRVKIRNEHFDDDRRIHLANRCDRAREMIGAAVLQVIARDSSDNDMFQFHPAHRLGYALRFVFFQRERFRRCHGAKSARARATVAGDHESGCALAPAFPAVRALRALANRVQPQIGNQRLC